MTRRSLWAVALVLWTILVTGFFLLALASIEPPTPAELRASGPG